MRRRWAIRAAAALAAAILAAPVAACSLNRLPTGATPMDVWLGPELVVAAKVTGLAPLRHGDDPFRPLPPDLGPEEGSAFREALLTRFARIRNGSRVALTVSEVLRNSGATGTAAGDVITITLSSGDLRPHFAFADYVARHALGDDPPTILLGLARVSWDLPKVAWRIAGRACDRDLLIYDDEESGAAEVRAHLAEAAAGR